MFKNKKILAGGAVFLVAAFWFYIKPHYMDAKPVVVYTDEQIAEAARPTIKLEDRVYNLKAPATGPSYLKASIALEFADPDLKYIKLKGEAIGVQDLAFTKEHAAEMPRVWDAVTSVIASRTVQEVSTPEGRDKLKTELMAAVNKELKHDKVENVYFITFITQ